MRQEEHRRQREQASAHRDYDGSESERVVEAAETIAAQVDRDVLVAERPQLAVDGVGDVGLQRACHLVAPDLEAGDCVVMPHAADAEPEIAQDRLGALDRPQLLFRHLAEVRNARRQARGGRLIPGGQSGFARELADLGLGQPDVVERAPDSELPRRLPTGTVVAAVVGVAAVGDHRNPAVAADRSEVRVQLVLAEVAAVRGIRAVVRARHLVGGDELVTEPELAREPDGQRTMTLGIARAVGGDAEGPAAEDVRGGESEIGAIDAAAVGDNQPGRSASSACRAPRFG